MERKFDSVLTMVCKHMNVPNNFQSRIFPCLGCFFLLKMIEIPYGAWYRFSNLITIGKNNLYIVLQELSTNETIRILDGVLF